MQPHEAALHAAQAAQSAAVETRDVLHELERIEQARQAPGKLERIRLTQTVPVVLSEQANERPTRSFAVWNPTAITIYIGVGNASPRKATEAWPCPANGLIVVPIAIGNVEIGVDPADQGALAAGDAVLFLIRFDSVQPAFVGKAT